MRPPGEGKRPNLFLDSSVVISAMLSSAGGSFRLFKESSEIRLRLVINQYVLAEVQAVLARKYPKHLDRLRALRVWTKLVVLENSPASLVRKYIHLVPPEDAPILAGAVQAKTDALITLDRKHFFNPTLRDAKLPFAILTPQDFFQRY